MVKSVRSNPDTLREQQWGLTGWRTSIGEMNGRGELCGCVIRSLPMRADFYELTVQIDRGTRVARFSSYADAMRAYDSARLDGAISAVVDRIQHTPHGMHRHVLAELA